MMIIFPIVLYDSIVVKSTKIPIECIPFSKASWIISTKDWAAVSKHFPFLKPFWASVKILFLYKKGISIYWTSIFPVILQIQILLILVYSSEYHTYLPFYTKLPFCWFPFLWENPWPQWYITNMCQWSFN